MEPFVTMGLVLKETRYREADRILTILPRNQSYHGQWLQNSLRLKGKLFSACGCSAIRSLHWCRTQYVFGPGKPMQNIFHGVSSSIEGDGPPYLDEMVCARLLERKQPGSCGLC